MKRFVMSSENEILLLKIISKFIIKEVLKNYNECNINHR